MNTIVKYLNTTFLCYYYTALIKVNCNNKIVNTIIIIIVIIIIKKKENNRSSSISDQWWHVYSACI